MQPGAVGFTMTTTPCLDIVTLIASLNVSKISRIFINTLYRQTFGDKKLLNKTSEFKFYKYLIWKETFTHFIFIEISTSKIFNTDFFTNQQ